MTTIDAYNRAISYLRISITDRCNLRCTYCMPAEGVPLRAHDEILRYEEIAAVVRAAIDLGIHAVRITGGEPLVRLGAVDLVRMLSGMPGVRDLSMTTNGVLLPRYARQLAEAGLDRINVSLDTLRPDRFRQVTRLGSLDDVLAGIAAAQRAGLEPIKINTVVLRGMNDDEVVDLASRAAAEGWVIRFIEWMPIGHTSWAAGNWAEHAVPAQEIRARIAASLGPLEPAQMAVGSGPATYFWLPDRAGLVGFITPISDHFCHRCNRLRLTADGQLRPCLLSEQEIDLRTPLRQGADAERIKQLIRQGIDQKPSGHHLDAAVNQTSLAQPECTTDREMSQIGG